MPKILILFAHPRFEKSRTNQKLIAALPHSPNIQLRDLYEIYPDFNINVKTEKELLIEHDVIVWHHPFYWYSSPPLLKQWIDMVLEFRWAYGPGGNNLKGKYIFNAITSGGPREVYNKTGYNRHSVREFLYPFEQTASLCQMNYLPPFVVQGTHKLSDGELDSMAMQYSKMLAAIENGEMLLEGLEKYEYLNDYIRDQKEFKL